VDTFLNWIQSWYESGAQVSSISAGQLLVFTGVGATSLSLGTVISMQRAAAYANWSMSENLPAPTYIGMVKRIPARQFTLMGVMLIGSASLLLVATMFPGPAGTPEPQSIAWLRVVLYNLGFILILFMPVMLVLFSIIQAVMWTFYDRARASESFRK